MKYRDTVDGRLRRAILASDRDTLRIAVSSTRDLNQVDETWMTPLLYAIYRGDIESAKILLEAGANPNFNPSPTDPTHTPLWHAEHDFGLKEIAELLRLYGAEK